MSLKKRGAQRLLPLTIRLCISSTRQGIIRAATINDTKLKCPLTAAGTQDLMD